MEGDNSLTVGLSFNPPPLTDGGLDDSDQFLALRADNLIVRRIQSNNNAQLTNRSSKLDHTGVSLKSSEITNTSQHNKSIGLNNRVINNSYSHVSPNSSKDMFSAPSGIATTTAHDYTEIMGYKNINISRDVDQSYMLKGSSTNRHSSQNNKPDNMIGYPSLQIEK